MDADRKSTCWTMIHAAADGDAAARNEFGQRYEPVIRAYLSARWRGTPHLEHVGDAVQDVFIEFLRDGGALPKAKAGGVGGFRAFLFGVVRNVARRVEQNYNAQKRAQTATQVLNELQRDDDRLTRIFDRAWAQRIMQEAAAQHRQNAEAEGSEAVRRYELLTLRFGEGLPIREIAAKWSADATTLHREYARARMEFEKALKAVVQFYEPSASDADRHSQLREMLGALDQTP